MTMYHRATEQANGDESTAAYALFGVGGAAMAAGLVTLSVGARERTGH
jgi:hypothetical protein